MVSLHTVLIRSLMLDSLGINRNVGGQRSNEVKDVKTLSEVFYQLLPRAKKNPTSFLISFQVENLEVKGQRGCSGSSTISDRRQSINRGSQAALFSRLGNLN